MVTELQRWTKNKKITAKKKSRKRPLVQKTWLRTPPLYLPMDRLLKLLRPPRQHVTRHYQSHVPRNVQKKKETETKEKNIQLFTLGSKGCSRSCISRVNNRICRFRCFRSVF